MSNNLPVNNSQFQIFSRNPNQRRDFRESWGAKTVGIKNGDFLQGIILGFEIDKEYGSKHIILKSFQHQGSQILIWGCSSIQNELHTDQFYTQMLYHAGDVVQITYKGSYIGKKGRSAGKLVAIFTIDEIVGYTLTSQDVNDVRNFQSSQKNENRQPMMQQSYSAPVALQQPQHQQYAQQTQHQYVQPQQAIYNQSQVTPPNPYATSRNQQSFINPVGQIPAQQKYAVDIVSNEVTAPQQQITQETIISPIPNDNSFDI